MDSSLLLIFTNPFSIFIDIINNEIRF